MIYVDDMGLKAEVPNGKRVVRGKWSHLYADTHEELMAIAQLIGLNPKWIQYPGTDKEHFDVVQSKRAAAIKAGARPVNWRHAGEFFAARRKAAAERQTGADNPDLIPRSQPVNQLLLVTGPRKGVPRATVEAALKPYFKPSILLVEGEADGVDKDSASLWESWGGLVERHAVSREEWNANPKGAGHARNRRMVARLKATGHGQVLAIDLPCTKDECKDREPHNTHGTSGCVTEAEKAGLRVDHFKVADFLAGQQKPPQSERPQLAEREHGPVWLGRFAGEMANCNCGTEFIRPVNGTYNTCLRCELAEKTASAASEYQHEATQWAEYNRQLGIALPQREERQAQ